MPHTADMTTERSPDNLKCDFCSSTAVEFAEEAADVSVSLMGMLQGEPRDTGQIGRSRGAWAACAECHRLIQDDKRQGLVRRAARSLAESEPGTKRMLASGTMTYADLNAMVAHMHAAFWSSRTGEFHLVAA